MSRTQPTDGEWAEMLFACATCGADRGHWCVTVRPWRGNPAGRHARWLHTGRWAAVREVVRLSGWQAWLEDEEGRARELRRQNVALTGGLIALQGELAQVAGRWPDHLVAPQPLVDRISTILTAAKETP